MTLYMHMYSGILIGTFRNWRQHLRTDVKKAEHQLEIYHTLNVLMEELDEGKFKEQLDAFIALWETSEPKFIAYFRATYASRAGKNIWCN